MQALKDAPDTHPNVLGLSTKIHKAKIGGNDSQGAAAFDSAIKALLAAQDPTSPTRGCLNEADLIDVMKKDKLAMRRVTMKPKGVRAKHSGVKPDAAQPGDDDFISGASGTSGLTTANVNTMLRVTAFNLGLVTASSNLKEIDPRVLDVIAAVHERQHGKSRAQLDDKTHRLGSAHERILIGFLDPELSIDIDRLPTDVTMAMVAHSDATGEFDAATMGGITSKELRHLWDVQLNSCQAAVRRSEVTGEGHSDSFVDHSSIRTAAAAHEGKMQPGDDVLDVVGSKFACDLCDPINVLIHELVRHGEVDLAATFRGLDPTAARETGAVRPPVKSARSKKRKRQARAADGDSPTTVTVAAHGNFDIILDHFGRISQLCPSPRAPRDMPSWCPC